jgi:photosystem II stability/assembly factor-like uncharacterized protein
MDGGTNWTSYETPFSNGYLQFLDANTGYVLEITGAAMNKQSVILYKTTNGGVTWVQNYNNDPSVPGAGNTLPLSGHKNGMAFGNTTTGWVGGGIPMNGYIYLYKTIDSGLTWAKQSMPLPIGYENAYIETTVPKFFSANDAILPVWMTLDVGMRDLFIYSTHNSGATWTFAPAFVRQGSNTDFVSMNNGITWDQAGTFHATNNAGVNWSDITPNINFGDNMPELAFVSTTTGWVVQNQVNGASPLYRTTDGGKTWTLLSPVQQPNTPTPTIPPTETPAPQDLGALGQSIVIALNARDFTYVRSQMDLQFGFAFWQSQGTSVSNDEAIQQLQTNYLGATPLTPDANKDLSTLLGGVDPYSIMGLDTSRSQALFVSGWGLDGKGEALLYFTRFPSGNPYWHSVLIAPTGFAPQAITHEVFCADNRIPPLIEQLKVSVNQSNSESFAALVNPTHGVDVRLWAYSNEVHFNPVSVKNIFTATDAFEWGGGPSGGSIFGSFKDIIQPKLLDVLNAPNMETYCDNLTKVYPLSNPWPYPNMRYYNLYKPASAAFFDFRTWLVGIEYVNGQPYISALVTIVWEP